MADHRKRFEKWRAKTPVDTRYLIDQVLSRIVPVFEACGFQWHAFDISEGIAVISLQKREGEAWPTVEINFEKRHPTFTIHFGSMPRECRTPLGEIVLREEASLVLAPAYLMLCKGKGMHLDGQFGYRWFSFNSKKKLESEVDVALSLLPVVIQTLSDGIPSRWLEANFGKVSKNVLLTSSWRINEERRKRKLAAKPAT